MCPHSQPAKGSAQLVGMLPGNVTGRQGSEPLKRKAHAVAGYNSVILLFFFLNFMFKFLNLSAIQQPG